MPRYNSSLKKKFKKCLLLSLGNLTRAWTWGANRVFLIIFLNMTKVSRLFGDFFSYYRGCRLKSSVAEYHDL